MGITQHRHAVANVEMIVALLLLRGNVGRAGAGVCPIRGHSNVQGDRTMGIDEKPAAAFLDRLRDAFGFEPPRAPGLDTVGAIDAMLGGRARVFVGMGGNFAAAAPDTEATHRALRQCELTVHVSTKFNRSHVVHGRKALLLPCLGRTEVDVQAAGPQSVTVEDSMSMVHLSAGRNEPASPHLLSEPVIVARIAQATLPASRVPWAWLVEDYGRIRDRIATVVEGFDDFNARVAQPGGFRLRNLAAERLWATSSGRAGFRVHPLAVPMPAADDELMLSTIRSHDQYNTTIYGLDDRYRGVKGHRRVVFINEADLRRLGLAAGEWVDITSHHAQGATQEQRTAQGFLLVPYDIPAGCVASYYPETNPLVPLHSVAVGAGTPTSKSIPVRLSRAVQS